LDQAPIDDLIDALAIHAELVEPQVVRDSDLSDRNDLPVLGTLRERYPIRSPAEFWAEHDGLQRRALQTPQASRQQPEKGWRQQPYSVQIGSRSITNPGHSAPPASGPHTSTVRSSGISSQPRRAPLRC
jgi:hypothetical protein